MLMEFKGYNSLGELTYVPVNVDTIGIPLTNNPADTAMTVIALNKLGTTITIYESVDDSYLPIQRPRLRVTLAHRLLTF